MLLGNGATIDRENAGSFTLDNELLASTEDGTLIFNTHILTLCIFQGY
jgi:hypothetical protein